VQSVIDVRLFIVYSATPSDYVAATGVYECNQQFQHDLRIASDSDVLDRITQVNLSSENMEDVMRGVLDLVLEVFKADRAGSVSLRSRCSSGVFPWSVLARNGRGYPHWVLISRWTAKQPGYSAKCSVPMA
jgi:hypothetical protein